MVMDVQIYQDLLKDIVEMTICWSIKLQILSKLPWHLDYYNSLFTTAA